MDNADLHIHSSFSDGLLSPSEIVEWGARKKLKAIAITDHDCLDGIDEAVARGRETGIEVIPGIELSTEYDNVEVHMLGYLMDYHDSEINLFLKKLRKSRLDRAVAMVHKLNKLGIEISIDDVLKNAENASSVGRPHVARAVVNAGYAESIKEVFQKYIGIGKPAFVERYKISPFEALEMITKCKGVVSIAHPGLIINLDIVKLVEKLADWGLKGIEVYHSKHTIEDVSFFKSLAERFNLIKTGGTDCHGELTNGVPMLGDVSVPYENVILLKEAKKELTHNSI